MKRKKDAFTLVELLIVVGILAVVIVGMMRIFIYATITPQLAANKTQAVSEAQDKIEEIRNYNFDSIATAYAGGGTPGNTFTPNAIDGIGVVYIDSSNASLLEIKVVVSWRDRYGRMIGEDINLNGMLDTGEDLNSNGEIDSMVSLTTLLAER